MEMSIINGIRRERSSIENKAFIFSFLSTILHQSFSCPTVKFETGFANIENNPGRFSVPRIS